MSIQLLANVSLLRWTVAVLRALAKHWINRLLHPNSLEHGAGMVLMLISTVLAFVAGKVDCAHLSRLDPERGFILQWSIRVEFVGVLFHWIARIEHAIETDWLTRFETVSTMNLNILVTHFVQLLVKFVIDFFRLVQNFHCLLLLHFKSRLELIHHSVLLLRHYLLIDIWWRLFNSRGPWCYLLDLDTVEILL